MKRKELIEAAIRSLEGTPFEEFAVSLIRQALYAGITPTSPSHDGGEDAITNPSVTFLNNGKIVSVAASKTTSITKLTEDCETCLSNNKKFDILVYATANDIQTDTGDKWKARVKEEFGWDLELQTPISMVPILLQPKYETFVEEYLNIPPPDGDLSQTIINSFKKITDLDLQKIRRSIPGLKESIHRPEIEAVKSQLDLGRSVILTGDAGTGKSGIGSVLVRIGQEQGKIVLFADARRFANFSSEGELSTCFQLNGTFSNAVARMCKHDGCWVVIDQFDSVIGSSFADTLAEITGAISKLTGGSVVIISRKKESNEINGLKYLLEQGFVEVTSFPLTIEDSQKILSNLKIKVTDELIELGRNLLNLELLAKIKERNSEFNFSNLLDDIDLWEMYVESIRSSEIRVINPIPSNNLIIEAIKLAKLGLKSPDSTFLLDSLTLEQRRLESWNVIIHVEGYRYQFMHEKLQDFLYSTDAADRGLMPKDILKEIPPHKSKTIFVWIQKLYDREGSNNRIKFMKETLDG